MVGSEGKRYINKLKYEDDEETKEDFPVIREEIEFTGESLEMPRIRGKR